ncbi:hypothetical protein ACHZ98_04800 [Streptomyces sp. MAR4 CNY-716]
MFLHRRRERADGDAREQPPRGRMPRGSRLIVAGAAVAGLLLVSGVWAVLGEDEPSPGVPVPGADLVHFASGHGYEPVRAVLRSRADVAAFEERFPPAAEDGKDGKDGGDGGDRAGPAGPVAPAGRDFGTEALVAFVWSTGCTSADSADLRSSKEQGLFAVPADTTEYRKCAEPWDVLAVFAVPREWAPHGVELAGGPPDPPGPPAAAADESDGA